MFVEINPKAANDRGIRNGEYVWVSTPTGAQAQGEGAGDRAGRAGHGASCRSTSPAGGRAQDMLAYYPEGAAPIVRGEAVNTATTYGYDSVTMMQETKTTLCQVERRPGLRREQPWPE